MVMSTIHIQANFYIYVTALHVLLIIIVIVFVKMRLKPLLSQPEHCNVCFWYTPPSLKCLPAGPEKEAKLHQVGEKKNIVLFTFTF